MLTRKNHVSGSCSICEPQSNPLDENGYLCPPPPDHIQIQTITGCNANCVFCPNRKTRRPIRMGLRMKWSLYCSVIDQCLALGVRRYTPYLMNEPLLDPELPKRIAYIAARKTHPQYIKITSHCGRLTERMSKGLLDSGLDKLRVSIQGLDPKIYWDLMKLPLDRTLRNIDRFLELKEQGRYKSPRIEAVIVDTIKTHDQIPRFRRYWQERGIKVRIEPLENRANHESIHDCAVGVRSLQPFSWCRRLMEQIYVLHDGRMVQCCADWEQNSIMGDLTTESLEDVWYGKRYSDYRHRLAVGKVKGMICKACRKQPPGI